MNVCVLTHETMCYTGNVCVCVCGMGSKLQSHCGVFVGPKCKFREKVCGSGLA